jgi:hypothetical protein
MTVGAGLSPLPGDSKATKDSLAATVGAPPSPRSPLPESQVCRGSRFWALAGESSNDEEESPLSPVSSQRSSSPRFGPSLVTLGDFLAPVWNQVALGVGGEGRPRSGRKFAPGGHRSRFGPWPDLGSSSSLVHGVRRGPVVVEGSGLGVRPPSPSGCGDQVPCEERASARRRDPRGSPMAGARDATLAPEVGGGPIRSAPPVVDPACQSQCPPLPTRPLVSLAQVVFGPPPPSPQAHSFRS